MMKKYVIAAFFLFFGFSSAQTGNWVGIRSGFPLGVTIHYGVENGLSNGFDWRLSGNIRDRGSGVEFGIGFDAMNTVAVSRPIEVYLGGGAALDFGNGALLDIHGLLGSELRFTDLGLDPLGLFLEVSLGAGFGFGRSNRIPSLTAAFGANFHF